MRTPPVTGPRKRKRATSRSCASPPKRSISAAGSRVPSTGGTKAARAILQNGVAVNVSSHHLRQRAIVREGVYAINLALFVVIDGAEAGKNASLRPLNAERNVRVPLKGTCNPGDVLVLADVATAADKGKVRTLPTAAGTYRGLLIAEEAGIDGQLVLARPATGSGNITVASP